MDGRQFFFDSDAEVHVTTAFTLRTAHAAMTHRRSLGGKLKATRAFLKFFFVRLQFVKSRGAAPMIVRPQNACLEKFGTKLTASSRILKPHLPCVGQHAMSKPRCDVCHRHTWVPWGFSPVWVELWTS